jgi:hypothetical protein
MTSTFLIFLKEESFLLTFQSFLQHSIPLLGGVVFYGDGKGFFRPDKYNKPFPPCYSCIEKVSLEEHKVLRQYGHDDNRVLTSLRLVDRNGIGKGKLVEFGEFIRDLPAVKINYPLLL